MIEAALTGQFRQALPEPDTPPQAGPGREP